MSKWRQISILAALVFLSWVILRQAHHDHAINLCVTFMIFVSFALTSLIILFCTDEWSSRSSGLLLTSMGTCALYLTLFLGILGYDRSAHGVNVIRSLFLVGGPFVLYSIYVWAKETWS